MITITNLSKNFTGRFLFKDVSLSIFPGEKIGLTGPNGSGKSTLFSILRGELESTEGDVQRQKNLRIGYLPQEATFKSDRTVLEEVTIGDDRIKSLLHEKRHLEEKGLAASARYGDVTQELEVLGIYDIEHKAEKILMGLGFSEKDFHKPILQMSGGWQMRTLLARLLVYPYDLLLLDEPTNYLDLSATLWLKDFLAAYQGTFVMISHDKVFLNDVTNYTILLENGQVSKVKGNYEAYESQKGIEQKHLERQRKVIEKKRQQLERFTQRFHAQPNRAAAVRNKRKMLERMDTPELAQEYQSIKDFEVPVTEQSGYMVASLEKIGKTYGPKTVYQDLNMELIRGQKLCLVGPNGAGKSTLLKMLAGVLSPDQGSIKLGHNVKRGYFSQTRLDVLNPNRTVLDELGSASSSSIPAGQMRSLLGLFNFHGDDVFKLVKVLSGGEKSRLILAKLLINPPNFILLDEPTTHLDIHGVEALTKAFKAYEGTLCFISHDLFFVKEVADHIIEVNDGQIKSYPGGLEYYLDKKQGNIPHAGMNERVSQKVKDLSAAQKKKDREQPENQKARLSRDKHKAALKRLSQIKTEISRLEKQIKDLDTESYVKARVIGNSYGKDPELLKEYGSRLKDIPKEQRALSMQINELKEEFETIQKGPSE
ncbi:MAG TPA: ABC-F family ATP-binding cassette domain-containing protein [Candidatus Omnitrophota bacterium]|nr:ABC-F family ATP-binding cassette domain-containing protein [Candidatus Omnitrophota bacterium]